MKKLVIVFFAFFSCAASGEAIADSATSAHSAQSVIGSYQYTMPPGFPFPGTNTITLSGDGTFRYDISLSRGKMAAFIGTWSFTNGMVIAVTNERFLEGKPYPPADPNGWKPGSEMHLYIVGDKLYKSKSSKEPFTKTGN